MFNSNLEWVELTRQVFVQKLTFITFITFSVENVADLTRMKSIFLIPFYWYQSTNVNFITWLVNCSPQAIALDHCKGIILLKYLALIIKKNFMLSLRTRKKIRYQLTLSYWYIAVGKHPVVIVFPVLYLGAYPFSLKQPKKLKRCLHVKAGNNLMII